MNKPITQRDVEALQAALSVGSLPHGILTVEPLPEEFTGGGPKQIRRLSDGKVFDVVGYCYEAEQNGLEITVEDGPGNWQFLEVGQYEVVA